MFDLPTSRLMNTAFLITLLSELGFGAYENDQKTQNLPRMKRQLDDEEIEERNDKKVEYEDETNRHEARFSGGEILWNYGFQAPYAVAIMYNPGGSYGEFSFACSGSFITPRTVLTVAHCFAKDPHPSKYLIVFETLNVFDPSATRMRVKKLISHEQFDYDMENLQAQRFDIGLMIINCDADHVGDTGYLQLPNWAENGRYLDPVPVWYASYGPYVSAGITVNVLKRKEIRLFHSICPERVGRGFDGVYHYCSLPGYEGGVTTWEGDSGTPVVGEDPNIHFRKVVVAMHTGDVILLIIENDVEQIVKTNKEINIHPHTRWILEKLRDEGLAENRYQRNAFTSWGISMTATTTPRTDL